jgi:hypothetical protein
MNMMTDTAEIVKQATPVADAVLATPVMTRREKLLRWAQIIRNTPASMHLYHGLEYQTPAFLDTMEITAGQNTAFALAAQDPILTDAGLPKTGGSIGDTMRFFELSQAELHEFSCDCGGSITNEAMADRLEKIAG